ncbi:TadE family protein [Streptomyces litchfieldiae]|uniref:Pilus assembly protein n=1 Tax=Streptomyces litchfieldiae TaxID=3075543 RepID=A0ABU2MN56_9ACTN|nr:pilus assembly protein [Streptomyces sp. DSM 44938]MDT0342368.1 pilus assembly protein [Streptomyces sp. DSM 44938]
MTPVRNAPRAQRRWPPWRRRRDAGVTAIEFAGWLPLLVIVALAGLQLGIAGYAALQAGSAARAAARTAAQEDIEDQYEAVGEAAVSDWLTVEIDPVALCGEEATVTARVSVPSVLPFIEDFGEASRTVTMPCD